MGKVFISYRQLNDTERLRVRTFAERVRASGIEVILDQFYLDQHPGGPPEKWPKWSSDRALKTEFVLIIGTGAWFRCFDGSEEPGKGLGAACEADDLRTRIYDAANINHHIRVVLFDDAESKHISDKLKGYHRFHAERDFENITKWLNPPLPTPPVATTSNNLPRLNTFVGREVEVTDHLSLVHPDAPGWGTHIDGPGGIGKTTLAIRIAERAETKNFDHVFFISAKTVSMDAHGKLPEGTFAIGGFLQLLDAIARHFRRPEISQAPEAERPALLCQALTQLRTLLVLDNLETFSEADQKLLLAFLGHLPRTCKAILTSRPLAVARGKGGPLKPLAESAALELLAAMAKDNPALAPSTKAERLRLIAETGGNTLLMTWSAGQVGSGDCTTIADALDLLRSCPEDKDPLDFIFGHQLAQLPAEAVRILCTLTYPTAPIPKDAIAEISEVPLPDATRLLKRLTNLSLVVQHQEERFYTLVPMAADFLRHHKPEVVAATGTSLENRAYALILENGYKKHDRFTILDAAWPTVAPALPFFLSGPSPRLQTICFALHRFLNFTGRWGDRFTLSIQAESRALATGDYLSAGWRAHQTGLVHYLRQEGDAVLACAARAANHWATAKAGARERASAVRLQSIGYQLKKDYHTAIKLARRALKLFRSACAESADVAIGLNDVAEIQMLQGSYPAAGRNWLKAERIARKARDREGVAIYTGNLADLALHRKDWPAAQALARKALLLSEKVGRKELEAEDNRRLAVALVRQGRKAEALPYAQKAVQLYTPLGSPDLALAHATLQECQA